MTVAILVLFVIIGVVAIAGAIWFIFYAKRLTRGEGVERLPFRWKYIILPIVIFFVTIVLSAYFYHLLPAEVAYRFTLDGTPDKWLSREMTIVWVLTPQLVLVLLAGVATWGITRLGILFRQMEGTGIKPERILLFMGNLVTLPQLVVGFVMLDIFSYNSYQGHIMPMWIFLLIILGLATIALGIFLVPVISRVKQQLIAQPRTKED